LGGIGAAIAYAALDKFTDQPVRNFLAVATIVFVVMLVPVALFAPEQGVATTDQFVLAFYYVLVAVPLVAFIVGIVDV